MAVLTYYISSTGSDSNDGLTSGTAWLTIDHAMQTADWASATGMIFQLSGTFTLTAPIRQNEINANWSVPVTIRAATLGGARVIHNHTGILVGNWAYRRILWKRMEVEFANTGSFSSVTFFEFSKLIFSRTGITNYTLGANHTWGNCEIIATTEAVIFVSLTVSCLFFGCTFTGLRAIALAGNLAHSSTFNRCRIVKCGTGNAIGLQIRGESSDKQIQSTIVSHCAFVSCGSTTVGVVAEINNGTIVRDCVVSNNASGVPFLSADAKVRDFTGNYHHGTGSLGSPIVIGENSNGSLTSAPYADPISGDWTVSSELLALTTSEGLTPGPVQAAGGSAGFTGIRGLRGIGT